MIVQVCKTDIYFCQFVPENIVNFRNFTKFRGWVPEIYWKKVENFGRMLQKGWVSS